MKTHKLLSYLLFIVLPFLASCSAGTLYREDFNHTPDRTWIGPEYWAVPLEDWRVKDGRLECIGNRSDMRFNLLCHTLTGKGNMILKVKSGLLAEGKVPGTAGFRIGIHDNTDNSVKSLCYFGRGTDAGISTRNYLFIDQVKQDLPAGFDLGEFTLSLEATKTGDDYSVVLTARDKNEHIAEVIKNHVPRLEGIVALVNNFDRQMKDIDGPDFWFDDLSIKGSLIKYHQENRFGPILWSMYTQSRGVLKMTAQMPPLGKDDNQKVQLQLEREGEWETVAEESIDQDARIAVFRLTGWDPAKNVKYRLKYTENLLHEDPIDYYYEGLIRKDPGPENLIMGGLTCQYNYGFPYAPVHDNLAKTDPDMLYFSGDQVYEANGGYSIIRFPAGRAILNYLGKWYMFGWAFGDLMRDRPTICTPDDHETFQGNIWGEGGEKMTPEVWKQNHAIHGGFIEPASMINVVMHTNTAHLPDPYDPTTMKQGIDVFYTDLVYGRISFAIVSDRIFKTGPESVAWWEGRHDLLMEFLDDPSRLDKPGLKLLGDRQLDFLKHWITDWKGADMKVLLSQTLFSNTATHNDKNKFFLPGDLDSGGWPKSGRDRAVRLMRKAFAYHICGDQHLPELVQYGIDKCRDAGWAFCTPAITVGWQRRFLPDTLGWPVSNRPEHNLPNTGCYTDAFGNKNYVYAVGNPDAETDDPNRYIRANKTASGFGIIRFNNTERTIRAEAYHFLADIDTPSPKNQFPGWPHTVNQTDNYGRKPVAWLPEIIVNGVENPVVAVTNEKTGELIYNLRISGSTFKPWIFAGGSYRVKVGDPENNRWKTFNNIQGREEEGTQKINVSF